MPNKIKSAPQMRMMYAAKAGKTQGRGPSPAVAAELLASTSRAQRSKFGKTKISKVTASRKRV